MAASFQEQYIKLNPDQKKAVDTIEGAVMVIAGPGTGKTQILTLRIANILLQTQVNPENILALTFTQSAVDEMRNRLVGLIGSPAYRVTISTFHGFCNDIIQQNAEEFGYLLGAESITEIDQIKIIEEILISTNLTLLKPIGDIGYYVKPSLFAINELKKEGVTVEKFTEAVTQSEADFGKIDDVYYDKGQYKGKMKGKYATLQKDIQKNKELLIVYAKYQEQLRTKKMYDFNDMLLQTIQAFTDKPELLLRLQEQYQYVLVDEHQDTNAAQNKITELLCNFYDNPNLFVVGDEKQAIFRFQGASLENFLYFKNIYPAAALINLTDNYRSSQSILDAAGSLIGNNKTILQTISPNNLQAKCSHPSLPVRILTFDDYHSEWYYLAKEIKEKIMQGVVPREIAILGRKNKDITKIASIFEQQNIPFVLESDQNILQDIDVQKLLLLFNTVAFIGEDAPLIRAMHIGALGIDPIDIYKLMYYAKIEKKTVWELLQDDDIEQQISFKKFTPIREFYLHVLDWKMKCKNETFDTLFIDVLKNSHLLQEVLSKPHSLIILDKITTLYDYVQLQRERNHLFSIEDFIAYITSLEEHQISITAQQKNTQKNGVRLMTTHRSKGLEFDYVYIIHVYEGHWGNAKKRASGFSLPWAYITTPLMKANEIDENEDERRLFYVALTRARKEIIISFTKHGIDGKEQIPSQFITEIDESYKNTIDTSMFETEFLKHKEIILTLTNIPKNNSQEYLENKELFKAMFVKQGLSATGLNNFLSCPWKYFFRNLLELPDSKTEGMIYGSAIHKALNLYLMHQNEKENTKEFLVNSFKSAIDQTSLTDILKRRLQQQGEKELANYFDNQIVNWKKNMISELPIRGIKFDEEIILNGKIDMIEPMENSKDVIVHDFKTGKPKSKAYLDKVGEEGNYKRQLLFYKILLDRYKNGAMHMRTGAIDFIQPSSSGTFKTEYFDILSEDVQAVEKQIRETANAIFSLSFWEKRCDDKECTYCLLRGYMSTSV